MMKRAEVTAFLPLVFVLIASFIGSVLDVTSLQVAKNYRRMDAERVIECVFAEYQKELLKRYDIFALDAGYESGAYSKELIQKRLEYYGLVNSENIIERIQFLSDENAMGFYEQAVNYMEHKYGVDYVKDFLEMTDRWEKQEGEVKDCQKEEEQNKDVMEELFAGSESQLPDEDNPISHVAGLKSMPILKLVIPDEKAVSEKTIRMEELVSHRELNKGYGNIQLNGTAIESVDKLLYAGYLLEHFSSAIDVSGNVLDYELEYILAGKKSDREKCWSLPLLGRDNSLTLFSSFVSNY